MAGVGVSVSVTSFDLQDQPSYQLDYIALNLA